MKINNSIERKVFLIFGSFALMLSLLYSVVCILVAYVVEDTVLERVVALEAGYLERSYQVTGDITTPRVDYMSIYTRADEAPEAVVLALANRPTTREVFTDSGVHYHIQYLQINSPERPLLVAEVTPLLVVTNVPNDILFLLAAVLILGLVLSICLAYLVARRTTKPVQTLAGEVMAQQVQNDPLSLSSAQSHDEIGYLALTIQNSFNKLKSALKRESEFTRDVSHELRTPLTVMKNTLALGQQRPWTDEDLDQLNASVIKMDQTVSTLLTLARAESLQAETLLLRPLLENTILGIHHKLDAGNFEINLEIPDHFQISANPQLMNLLIRNLIENAIEHASQPVLTIRLENHQLIFANPADKSVSQNVVQPNIKGSNSEGIGQGLYLVSRIIESLNWSFKIESENESFSFSIRLSNPGK
ncbi:MAG: HAMP domain-containing histidine kinase [Gammaproteobacteria bacterium]|jgi:signal transduction histidine kinase|nr:HAMP domain-containing histidine kinase [Gammaproteobacteria bacterium]